MASNDPLKRKLFTDYTTGTPYPNGKHQDHLLEQYKAYTETTDKISARRESANSFFLTVNTTLIGFVGYIGNKDTPPSNDYIWLMGVVGIVLCYIWSNMIKSYSDINTAKFAVIHAIEEKLPLSPYAAEWDAAGQGRDPKKYKPLTNVERKVPWVFLLLHVVVVLQSPPISVLIDAFKGIWTSL